MDVLRYSYEKGFVIAMLALNTAFKGNKRESLLWGIPNSIVSLSGADPFKSALKEKETKERSSYDPFSFVPSLEKPCKEALTKPLSKSKKGVSLRGFLLEGLKKEQMIRNRMRRSHLFFSKENLVLKKWIPYGFPIKTTF